MIGLYTCSLEPFTTSTFCSAYKTPFNPNYFEVFNFICCVEHFVKFLYFQLNSLDFSAIKTSTTVVGNYQEIGQTVKVYARFSFQNNACWSEAIASNFRFLNKSIRIDLVN